ncbi:MAG: hypothetical protein Q4D99_04980 [Bacillota bacterium]|nr:hypothetical protein [Bacillota bacterium]
MARKQKVISVASYNDNEYDQFTENITRVRYIKYFKGTRPSFRERESTGILTGAFLSLTIGCIAAPYLLLIGSHFSHKTIIGFAMIMAAATVFLGIWGFRKMAEEKKRVYRPVPDEEFDRYLAFDLKGLIVRARLLVTDKTPVLKAEEDSIMEVEPIVLYSAEGYSSDVNLPLLLKCGDDGIIRASNLYVMVLFPTKKGMYINITYLNLCSGKAKFDRIYACPYEDVDSITYKKRNYDIVTQEGKEVMKRVKSFLIKSSAGDTAEVGVDVIDYDIIDTVGGHFDETAVNEAMERLAGYFPGGGLPNKKPQAKLPKAD